MRQIFSPSLIIRNLGCLQYLDTFESMKLFTSQRQEITPDEIWLLEHFPVFTQGQAGNEDHILRPGNIPVIQCDRGGHVTYHGPGQITGYVLIDLERLGIGIRDIVSMIEKSVIETLSHWGISATTNAKAPGVFVGDATTSLVGIKKISSLGLRIRRGCSYHGFNLNVDMDLEPWSRINPCGLDLEMTQVVDILKKNVALADISSHIADILAKKLGYNDYEVKFKFD